MDAVTSGLNTEIFPLSGNGLWRDFRCLPRRCPSLSLWARRTGPPGVSGGTTAPSAGPSSGTVTVGCFPWQREPAGRRWQTAAPFPAPSGAVLSGHLQRGRLLESVYSNPGASRRWTHSAAPLGRYLGPAAGLSGFASELFPHRRGWKRRLLTLAAQEIQRQETAGYARYLDGWRRRLRQQFNPMRFYLTPEGLAFFYPMYAIAPAAEGIPVFTVPYEAVGPYVPVSEAEPSSSAPQT